MKASPKSWRTRLGAPHSKGDGGGLAGGSALWPIHPRVAPKGDGPMVDKTQPSAFVKTDMKKVLKARGGER